MWDNILYMLDLFIYHFPISGVETYIFFPPLVMFLISALVSTAGVSGAFILLPFQMSVLGYTTPGVTATNFIYNIVSIPLGASRYKRERRIPRTLLTVLILGTLPGIFLGYLIRILYLPDPQNFKIFVGFVLVYLGIRTLQGGVKDLWGRRARTITFEQPSQPFTIQEEKLGFLRSSVVLGGERHSFPTLFVLIPALATGVIGGAYGIGGGAIMAPICIAILNIPVYIVPGATLSATWVASVISVLFYAFGPLGQNVQASPDWLLGLLFGFGGLAGIYVGAKIQKWMSSGVIKLILSLAILFIALKYLSLLFTVI